MSHYKVDIQLEYPPPAGAEIQVRNAVMATLNRESEERDTGLSLLFTDDEMIRTLNRQFLGEDKPTDVLSFPTGEPTPGTENYLGDIAISVPTAQKQAEAAGYPVVVELQLLAIHGTLHLLGFNHLEIEDKHSMWQAQSRVLADLGIEFAAPP